MWDWTERSAVMAEKLYSLCVCLLLLAALCPGAHCKRGGIFRGRGKSDGNKQQESQSKGLSKQGLKWVGAAAGAGMLGGTGTGYGLGFLGKGKHRSGHKSVSSDQQMYRQGQTAGNKSQWNSAAAPNTNYCVCIFGYVVPFLITAWIRGP